MAVCSCFRKATSLVSMIVSNATRTIRAASGLLL